MKQKVLSVLLALGLVMGFSSCAQKVELTGLSVNAEVPVLTPGQSAPVELSYSFTKETPTEDEITSVLENIVLVWSSSDEAVATVDNGMVTAHAAGNAVVTVTDDDGLYSATVDVSVVVPVESASVQDALTLDLLAGEEMALGVSVLPAGATAVEITYASSDAAVVSVDALGILTPIGEGEAQVTTTISSDTTEGRTEKVLHTTVIVAILPQGIALESTEGVLYVGYSFQLEPYSLPDGAPETTYSFSSSDEAVATVDETGNIKAVAVGTSTITITSAEGHTLDYALTVTAAPRQGGGSNGRSGGTGGSSGGAGGTGGSGSAGGTGGGTGGGDAGGGGGDAAPPPSSGGDSGGSPNIGDGTAENPYENEYVGVGEDDLHGNDGLGGDGGW